MKYEMIKHRYVKYYPIRSPWTVFGDLTDTVLEHIERYAFLAEMDGSTSNTIYLETIDTKADIFVRKEIKQIFVFIHYVKINGKWHHYRREIYD